MSRDMRHWSNEMKIRLLKRMEKWHLKYFDKQKMGFVIPHNYKWSGRTDEDANGRSIKSPDYMCHELDYHPRRVIVGVMNTIVLDFIE